MDFHLRGCMRVIRKLNDADELIKSFPGWETTALSQDAASSWLSPQDQLCILDFPNPETQAANIAKSSTLGKENLLSCAVETPSQLSDMEIKLLKDRYWLDISLDEQREIHRAWGILSGPIRSSEKDSKEAEQRLKAVRHPLYAEKEEKAIHNAFLEFCRRSNNALHAKQEHEAEESLPSVFPWMRRMWEEDKGRKPWGYSIFVDPGAFVDDEEVMQYDLRQENVFFHSGAGLTPITRMWHLKQLGWPIKDKDEGSEPAAIQAQGGEEGLEEEESGGEEENAEDEVSLGEEDSFDEESLEDRESFEEEDNTEEERRLEEAADKKRPARFEGLRQYFKYLRDREQDAPTQVGHGGSKQGMLRNVFLVVDKASVDSMLRGVGVVDDMWIWAVDPDHDDANNATATSAITEVLKSAGTHVKYKGFMRVRLQQLVNNFYDARRFHEDEYPMKKLWEAAQKSKNQAFVSLKDDEARSFVMDRFLGSAMRPGAPRIVYGTKSAVPAGPSAS